MIEILPHLLCALLGAVTALLVVWLCGGKAELPPPPKADYTVVKSGLGKPVFKNRLGDHEN